MALGLPCVPLRSVGPQPPLDPSRPTGRGGLTQPGNKINKKMNGDSLPRARNENVKTFNIFIKIKLTLKK